MLLATFSVRGTTATVNSTQYSERLVVLEILQEETVSKSAKNGYGEQMLTLLKAMKPGLVKQSEDANKVSDGED